MRRIAQILLVVTLLPWGSRGAEARARGSAAVSARVKLRVVRLARQGKRAFLAKRYDEAVGHWRRAYNLWPKPQLLYNIALAYERAGQPALALTFLRAFFVEAKTQRQRAAVLRGARRLERALVPRVAVLGLTGFRGAQVFLDGKLAGTLPLEVVLTPGAHQLELRAPGRATVRRALELQAGRTTVLELQLPLARPRPILRPRPGPGPVTPRPTRPAKGLHMAYALGAAGLALALAGAAVGTGLLAVKRYDAFQADPTLRSRARVKTLQDATNGLWAVAGAAGVAVVVLAIFTRWRSRPESATRPTGGLDIDVGPGGLGLTMRGRF